MKQFSLFLILISCAFWSCQNDDDEPVITEPTIALSSTIDFDQAVCFNVPFEIRIELRTSSEVGIESFSIVRNGTETLIEETAITPNILNYTFAYAANSADLDQGNVVFTITLNDKNGDSTTEMLDLEVVNEFAYLQETATPEPSWDLVKNESVAASDGANVDIALTTETESCGFNCTNYRFTFTSKNGTRFYSLPLNTTVSPFNRDLKQATLIAEIEGVTPVQELVAFSSLRADATATGDLDNLPIVVQIRGTDEYALIERVSGSPGTFIYRKRSAEAGGN
ncbi:MAG: hypothetical protein AAF146_11740 [Bacteroidota bacterium]